MCANVDYYPHSLMNMTLATTQYDGRTTWRNSISSSSSSSITTTSWLERKLFSHFKRFFRRNSSSFTSNSSTSSRRPSSPTNEDVISAPVDEQPLPPPPPQEVEPVIIIDENPPSPTPIDLLYDYDRLLVRCLERREHDRTKMILRCQTPISIPHADLLASQSRTIILNWKSYIRLFHFLSRDSHLFQQYINEYYSCQSSVNLREQLTLEIRTTKITFDRILQKFLDDYVTCLICQTAQTHLIKSDGRWRIECQLCGSQRTVKRLKWKHHHQ